MNIAFVSFGSSLNHLGKILTFYIRKSNPNSFIIQITNAISNKINGGDEMIIHSFNKDTFMLNRLKSQIITIKNLDQQYF